MRQKQGVFSLFLLSPSSRRAWIEICSHRHPAPSYMVALREEGVDRNQEPRTHGSESRPSPSARRAWIEI